jgi:ligand-binding sensor domain-containing protein
MKGAILAAIACLLAHGQATVPLSKLNISRWGVVHGLPEESIYWINETPDGYIWLATRDQLVRFDGRNFRTFDPAENAPNRDNGIGALAWDGRRLWVGARDYVAYTTTDLFGALTNVRFQSFRFPRAPDDRWGIAEMKLIADRQLLIRRNEGIYALDLERFDAKGWTLPTLVVASPVGEFIQGMAVDAGALSHILTNKAAYRCVHRQGKIELETIADAPAEPLSIALSRNDGLWIGTYDHVFRQRGGWRSFASLRPRTSPEHTGIFLARDGALWTGSARGVKRIDGDSEEELDLRSILRADELVITFHQAQDGAIWCGTR